MAWDLDNVTCDGFPRALLPVIARAISSRIVEWIPGTCTTFAEYGYGEFKFANCIWGLEEMTEIVTRVQLLKGDITSEDLTAAVLKGRFA